MVPDPVWSLGHGQSLWTNWRWTNFSLSHQLPLCSKGHLGYWHNLKFIYMGLPLWATCRKIVGWPSVLISSSKGNATCQFLSGVHHFVDIVYRKPPIIKPLWAYYVDCIFQQNRHMSFAEWMVSLRCPHFWALYISAFPLLPLTFLTISFLPTRPRASSSFPPSFQVFPLPS